MALTDNTYVRLVGGLNEADAYQLFRVADNAALNALVDERILDAAAWLDIRANADYNDTSDTSKQRMFKLGEAYLALHFLVPALESRKVLGTQWPLDQEDSESFSRLTDTDWMGKMKDLLEPYLVIEAADKPFAAPAMVFGAVLDRSTIEQPQDRFDDLLDEANSQFMNP
jgi:hypothetical protein